MSAVGRLLTLAGMLGMLGASALLYAQRRADPAAPRIELLRCTARCG